MAAGAFKRETYGTFNQTLGNLVGSVYHSIVVFITAKKNPEVIRRILASYSDAAINTPDIHGRIIVVKQKLSNPDTFAQIDPRSIVDIGQASVDQGVTRKEMVDLLRQGDVITVPAGETYTIILTAAYTNGDANGAPSNKIARLTVLGATSSGGKKVELY